MNDNVQLGRLANPAGGLSRSRSRRRRRADDGPERREDEHHPGCGPTTRPFAGEEQAEGDAEHRCQERPRRQPAERTTQGLGEPRSERQRRADASNDVTRSPSTSTTARRLSRSSAASRSHLPGSSISIATSTAGGTPPSDGSTTRCISITASPSTALRTCRPNRSLVDAAEDNAIAGNPAPRSTRPDASASRRRRSRWVPARAARNIALYQYHSRYGPLSSTMVAPTRGTYREIERSTELVPSQSRAEHTRWDPWGPADQHCGTPGRHGDTDEHAGPTRFAREEPNMPTLRTATAAPTNTTTKPDDSYRLASRNLLVNAS